MNSYPSLKMNLDAIFKLGLLVLFAYLAYLLNGYSNNGRYEVTSFGDQSFLIIDTRSGETLRYKPKPISRSETFLFNHQAELKTAQLKNSKAQ